MIYLLHPLTLDLVGEDGAIEDENEDVTISNVEKYDNNNNFNHQQWQFPSSLHQSLLL